MNKVSKPRIKSLKPSDAYMHSVIHICIGKLTIIGSDNGLLPRRWQVIIWTSVGILLIGPLGTNFRQILFEVQTFSLKKTPLKMSSVKCCPFHFSLNVLSHLCFYVHFISHILCYFMENHHNIGRCHQGLTYLDIIFLSTLKNLFFKTDYIQEEKFIKIHLPESRFYLPQTFVNVIHKIASDAFYSGSICKMNASQIFWKNGLVDIFRVWTL